MTPYFSANLITLYHGDCRELLQRLPEKSINSVVTSPPYWNLRDYGVAGQIGMEATPEEYVVNIVGLFRIIHRLMKDDGTIWLNLGDSYASHPGQRKSTDAAGSPKQLRNPGSIRCGSRSAAGIKPKDLVGIPWMVAFALRADGWYLRNDNIWAKPNGMPESVQDRCTRSHEYVFHLSKSERYYHNAEAIRTAPKASTETRLARDTENQFGSMRANGGNKTNGAMKAVGRRTDNQRGHSRRHQGFNDRWDAMEREEQMEGSANIRTVWWISPAQFKQAHFAVMPPKLARICVRAGTPHGGTVLDPFFGAGTTGYVCQQEGVRCIGTELNQEYCDIAKNRLSQGFLYEEASHA